MNMKEITIIIRPNMYFKTKEALHKKGIFSMNSQLVYGRGKNTDINIQINKDTNVDMDIQSYPLLAKKQMNIVVRDEDVQTVIDTVIEVNRTNTPGDGKIFVTPTEKVFRIRTKECDNNALV